MNIIQFTHGHISKQVQTHAARARQRGLTAIELLVTFTILAILVGIAAPSMSRFINQWRASNTVNALTGSLRIARTEAIARGRPVVVCRVASSTATACETTAGTKGYASGWIVFVNNDRDANNDFSSTNGDELLLRQVEPSGIAIIKLKTAGRFVFMPNGLLNGTANGIDIDATGFSSASATPWARKALCITKPGRVRSVANASDCDSNEG
ncbi:GspH/FimT family pseudopilin [Variovorax sp. EBFNA2]|uniref:GspH/FimT family pseudopilin n=1 Tax=Variovorax sp. EBFNA2 TaxID=3342097 RepID=UPI0029C05F2E|nr:GspH/FimT family pseudopilin [Variovorax boronicumulans]WPG37640.1 GspH/FimT family pseudopilin [Variovorax boronicumulans]